MIPLTGAWFASMLVFYCRVATLFWTVHPHQSHLP